MRSHWLSGRVIAFFGLLNIFLGRLFADQRLAARGHRQRVIGLLQVNCNVDRQTVNEFIDRWLSRRASLRSA